MRALILSIVLLVVSPAFGQQPKEITNSIGMKLVLIHPGSFTMGSPVDEVGRSNVETSHEVTHSKSYYIGVYEVTQEQYEKVMGSNPSYNKGAKNPVESVSWEDAVSFCKKLSKISEEKAASREYRLPTEAEWEYACRAGSKTAYCFGDSAESLEEYAWFGKHRDKSHPVGLKKPNQWGLYDMHGNVYEFCQDWWSDFPSGSAIDPQGPERGSSHVFKGGGWGDGAVSSRSAVRGPVDPSNRNFFIGFRVALSPSFKLPETPRRDVARTTEDETANVKLDRTVANTDQVQDLWATPEGLLLIASQSDEPGFRGSAIGFSEAHISNSILVSAVRALITAEDFEQALQGIDRVSGEGEQLRLLQDFLSRVLAENQLSYARDAVARLRKISKPRTAVREAVGTAIEAEQLDFAQDQISHIESRADRVLALVQLAKARQRQGASELAIASLEDALNLAGEPKLSEPRRAPPSPFGESIPILEAQSDPEHFGMLYHRISEAFIQCEQPLRALEIARLVIVPKRKLSALMAVAEKLAEAKDTDDAETVIAEALPLVVSIEDPIEAARIARRIFLFADQVGHPELAREAIDYAAETLTREAHAASSIQQKDFREARLAAFSRSLAAMGKVELALELADQIDDYAGRKSSLLSEVSLIFAEAGEFDAALETALSVGRLETRTTTLSELGPRLAKLGMQDQLNDVVAALEAIEPQILRSQNSVFVDNGLIKLACALARVEDYESAIRVGKRRPQSAQLNHLSDILSMVGRLLARSGESQKAFALANKLEPFERNHFLENLTLEFMSRGELQLATQAAESIPDMQMSAWSLGHIASAAFRLDRPKEGLAGVQRARSALKKFESPISPAALQTQMARDLTDAGVPEVALTVAIEISGEVERVGAIYYCAIGLAAAGSSEKAIQAYQRIEPPLRIPSSNSKLAEALANCDAPDLALRVFRQGKDTSWLAAKAMHSILRAQLRGGDFDVAIQLSSEFHDQDVANAEIAQAMAQAQSSPNAAMTVSKALELAQSVRDDKLRARTLRIIAQDLATDSFPRDHTGIEPFRSVKNEFTPKEAAIAKVVAEAIRSN